MKITSVRSAASFSITVLLLTLLANLSGSMNLVAISQLAPMITVLLMLIFVSGRRDSLRSSGLGTFGGLRWYFAAILSIVPIGIGFLAAWAFGIVQLPSAEFLSQGTARFTVSEYAWYITKSSWAPQMLISMLIFSFGEEIGWRGYLQPKLTEAYGIRKSILITAAVWACFHYPFYLNQYNTDGNVWISLVLFTVMIFPLSVYMGWVRWRSRSIWPAVLIHMVINLSRSWLEQLFFDKATGWSYVAGESGIITIAVWAACAAVIWIRLGKRARAKKTSGELSGMHAG
ncbi:membrane protease YdiL (CAAX protease family) [Paenibacillus rhizosphaerae]|uniref:Membrane protease YdiL (CAAX protease family) n=1 Tax=Paenibacillus rhizosphaerae TaxID=297318 RepID=A0A839U269_9BACL|nr:CPBP family intramembrane glutamic endopeptidase [Paenibacillus rhizosphaerae]MBB3131860.1 membrane protease YdiL (CAAX protease family) [Paenibacillus rhizosphaerae]